MEHAATPAWALLAYLVSGVLFILALRGLSSPSTSQRGNRFGMIGMLIAVVTTLLTRFPESANHACDGVKGVSRLGEGTLISFCDPDILPDYLTFSEILAAIAIGGSIGWIIARRIKMTDMPQLVAAFHASSAWLRCWSAGRLISTPSHSASPVPTA